MGCGSSKSATDSVQPASVSAPGNPAEPAAEPLAENVATVDPPVIREQAQPVPSKMKEKVPPTVTAEIQDPHAPDPHAPSINDDADKPVGRVNSNQKAKAVVEPPAPVSKGIVMDRVGAILNKDDDDFGSDDDVIAAASKLLDEPSGIPADKGTFRMQGSSKPAQKMRNPISDNLGDIDTPADSPMAASSQKDPVRNTQNSQKRFTDISNGGSALPSVQRGANAGNGAWSMHSDLDALMDAPEDSRTRKQHRGPDNVEQVLEFTQDDMLDEEEEDTFNAMAIPPPKFAPPSEPKFDPKPRAGRGGAPAEPTISLLDEEPEASADPWDMLQNQYRIRDSDSAEGRRRGSGGFKKGQLDPEEELILDEYTGNNAPVRKKKPEPKRRPVVPDLPPRKGGVIAANWGEGEMAQAGDLMLGRGALDYEDDAGFSGYGELSGFSAASYVEYRGNERSMDMEVLEVPKLDSTGLDMEDFNEEMEMYGIIKPKGKPTLEDKLRMFEGMNDDLDDDDLLLQEELRLASQDY